LSPPTTIWVQTECHCNASCLATKLKILGFMTKYFGIANISNWCTRPCDGYPYSVSSYSLKVNLLYNVNNNL